MNIDMSQFSAAFLEEAQENLADLEAGLLQLENGDSPDMNAIFRAAHSIKGGAGTFGFNDVADFTHVVESVLEKARDGVLDVTEELSTELLKSVDVIGELLAAARENREADVADRERCLKALESYLSGGAGSAPKTETVVDAAPAAPTQMAEERIVSIQFKPHPNLPQTGSDPINIIRELMEMGEVTPNLSLQDLPSINGLIPEELHLVWDIEIITSVTDDQLHDVFLFVEDEADVTIKTIAAIGGFDMPDVAPQAAQSSSQLTEEATATPLPERREGDRRQSADRRGTAGAAQQAAPASSYIRVDISKIDKLLNLVGELVTTNAMVTQHMSVLEGDAVQNLMSATEEMGGHTRNLQEAIMSIRMMPVDFAFNRFPRMVRDTATKLGKKVRLETDGAQTELDKTVIERITDPLTHLVRNSIDHGIEMPEERAAAGKPEEGVVQLSAFYRGGNVIIEIKDDGKGLSREKIVSKALEKGLITQEDANTMPDDMVWELIFNSGFSTAAQVTDVSGRGIGMDVVRKNIQSLGGSVSIKSEQGVGSCFSVSLPLTLAIVDGMATKVGDEIYLIPLLSILESIKPSENLIKKVQDGVDVIDFRGEYIPLLRVSEVLQVPSDASKPAKSLEDGIAVIVETDVGKNALFVDELLGERQVVIKNIEDNYESVEGVSGATILGDGRVALILDLTSLAKMAAREGRYLKRKDIKNKKVAAISVEEVPPQPIHEETTTVH